MYVTITIGFFYPAIESACFRTMNIHRLLKSVKLHPAHNSRSFLFNRLRAGRTQSRPNRKDKCRSIPEIAFYTNPITIYYNMEPSMYRFVCVCFISPFCWAENDIHFLFLNVIRMNLYEWFMVYVYGIFGWLGCYNTKRTFILLPRIRWKTASFQPR